MSKTMTWILNHESEVLKQMNIDKSSSKSNSPANEKK